MGLGSYVLDKILVNTILIFNMVLELELSYSFFVLVIGSCCATKKRVNRSMHILIFI